MKLKDCTLGKIVVDIDGHIGMIMGITTNCDTGDIYTRRELNRAIPLVKFSGEFEARGIHQGNIEPYKGGL